MPARADALITLDDVVTHSSRLFVRPRVDGADTTLPVKNRIVESRVKVGLRARCGRAPEVARPAWGSRAATADLIMILGGQKMPSARPNDRHGPQTGRFGLPIVFQQLGGQSRLSQ